jgi:protein phosphatase methylesterase 1
MEATLDTNTLLEDAKAVFEWTTQKFPSSKLVLVGHSLGGAIATKMAHQAIKEEASVHGLVVIDASENGTIKAVSYTEQLLNMRPRKMQSKEYGVLFSFAQGMVFNIKSARFSIPSQLTDKIDGPTGLTYYDWKTDIIAAKEHWVDWFKGMNELILEMKTLPKLFVVSTADKLDK